MNRYISTWLAPFRCHQVVCRHGLASYAAAPLRALLVTVAAAWLVLGGAAVAQVDQGTSCTTATSLVFGVEHSGYHDFEGDLDYVAVDVPSRGVVRLQVRSTALFAPRVQMLGGDCLGLSPNRPRSLAGSDHDRLFYVETPGRQIVRVGGRETGAAFHVMADFEPMPTVPTAQLEAWWDAPDLCSPGGLGSTTEPPPEEDDMDVSQITWPGGLGSTTEPPPEEDDMDVSQITWPGGLGSTTEPPPEEDDMDVSQITWPNDDPNYLPKLEPASFVRFTGDFDGLADEDVLWVRITEAGVLEVEADGVGVAASLYAGSECISTTRVVHDAALSSEPLQQVVTPGDYRLQLTSNSSIDGAYQLAVRLMPVPGRR